MSLKTPLSELLHYMRDQYLAFSDRLTGAERAEIGAADAWSAKDELAHAMVWADRRLSDLETFERGEAWPEHDYGDFDDANRAIFEEHQHRSWDEVQEMIRSTYAGIDAYLKRTSEETLLTVPEGQDNAIWRGVAGSYVYHPMSHLWDYLYRHGHSDALGDLFGEQFVDRLLAVHDSDEWRGTAYYNLACIYALSGKTGLAIDKLAEALRLHPGLIDWSKQDPDLASIRDEPAYQALYV
ncbi:MAG: ClbS/DfsB family four-helix bundle protein [Anaerolineae bacterium]|nr:ClbS/DfsB family four-helix bundle protein [Anaerolineae bacterium]